jgi:hypothetical protein
MKEKKKSLLNCQGDPLKGLQGNLKFIVLLFVRRKYSKGAPSPYLRVFPG